MPSPTKTINMINAHIVDPVNLGLTATLPSGISGTINHSAKTGMIHTKIVTTAALTLVSSVDNAAKGGGIKIFDFPLCRVVPMARRIKGTLGFSGATMSSTAGEIGLGSVVASGAIATFTTATFDNILEGSNPDLGNIAAAGTTAVITGDSSRADIGDFATAVDLYINACSTFADATAENLVLASGAIIELWWIGINE